MTVIHKTINLLLIMFSEYQEVTLIRGLNDFFVFDHNIFLFHSSVDRDRFITSRIKFQTPQSVYAFDSENISGLENVSDIKSKNTFMIVVPGSSGSTGSFLRYVREIQKRKIEMKIGIFFTKFVSTTNLVKLFQWCKDNLIINVFSVIYPQTIGSHSETFLNIFTFNHFGVLEAINVTSSDTYKNFFTTYQPNFQQHQLTIGIPFPYYVDEVLWPSVFSLMNGSFQVITAYSDNVSEIFDRGIDLFLTKGILSDLYTYPVSAEPWIILVPEALPYPDFAAYLQVLTTDRFFDYCLAVVAAVIFSLTFCRYIKQKKLLLLQSVTDVGNLLMNDNGYIKYGNLSRAESSIIVPLTFVGLIIVKWILSNLTSYVTRPILQPQIRTIEQIYKAQLPILTYTNNFKNELNHVLSERSDHDWSDKIIIGDEVDDEIYKYNRSSMFYLFRGYATVIIQAQKRLGIKGFYDSDIRIASSYGTYAINEKFIFVERLNEIIDWTRCAGLFDKWSARGLLDFENDIVDTNQRLRRFIIEKELEVTNFDFPMFVVYGWIASTVVLIIELLWEHLIVQWMRKFLQVTRTKFLDICRISNPPRTQRLSNFQWYEGFRKVSKLFYRDGSW